MIWTDLLALGLRANDLDKARQALELARTDLPEPAMRVAAVPVLLDLPPVWLWPCAAWR